MPHNFLSDKTKMQVNRNLFSLLMRRDSTTDICIASVFTLSILETINLN